MTFKQKIQDRIGKLLIALDTPGALAVRRAGCYFELYQMVYRMYAMGFRPGTILDIGANRGMFTRCAHRIYPDASIHAFEPLEDCYDELCRLKEIHDKLHCYNIALGDENRETEIHRSQYDYSSSVLEMTDIHKEAFPFSEAKGTERIEMRTLDSIMTANKTAGCLMMKIDVQGFEKQVLVGASQTLKRTAVIVCELSLRPLYKGQSSFEEVFEYIRSAGFRFAGQLGELKHPVTHEVLQVDGLFVRDAS